MSKYIDADKLKVEVERRLKSLHEWKVGWERRLPLLRNKTYYKNYGKESAYDSILNIVTSLQQEQSMPNSTQLIELWHKDKEMLKEKDFRDDPWRLAYNAFMCGFGRGVVIKKEHSDVDLEKEIQEHIKECLDIKFPTTDIELIKKDVAYTARKFYELGRNARKKK